MYYRLRTFTSYHVLAISTWLLKVDVSQDHGSDDKSLISMSWASVQNLLTFCWNICSTLTDYILLMAKDTSSLMFLVFQNWCTIARNCNFQVKMPQAVSYCDGRQHLYVARWRLKPNSIFGENHFSYYLPIKILSILPLYNLFVSIMTMEKGDHSYFSYVYSKLF